MLYDVHMDYNECSAGGCSNVCAARNLCAAHYGQQSRGATTFRPVKQVPVLPCEFDGCSVVARVKGLCQTHYTQQLRGEPLAPKWKAKGSSLVRDELGRKQCAPCKSWLPVTEFSSHGRSLDGLNSYCRRCATLHAFGMTRTDYETMLAAQGGTCAICNSAPEVGAMLSVDHDHSCCDDGRKSCGRCVRALLCPSCNSALGMMRDNPERLRAAATYLEGFRN